MLLCGFTGRVSKFVSTIDSEIKMDDMFIFLISSVVFFIKRFLFHLIFKDYCENKPADDL